MKTFREYIQEAKTIGIYPHGGGVDIHDDGESGNVSDHPVEKTVGNEPFKDNSYFRRPKLKKYLGGIRRSVAKKKKMPPVVGTPHPADSSVRSIVDGNHRLRGTKNARASNIPVEHVPHENIRLMPQSYDNTKPDDNMSRKLRKGPKLSSFRKRDGTYDMNKPRKRLGGNALNHYFANPDGSHNFRSPK